MAIPKGLWDDTLVPDGWFDDTQQTVGWWDADLLDTTASGTHSATGDLVGQGSAVVGSALHPHTTSGAIVGAGSAIVGSSARSAGTVSHATSGDLVGQGSAIVGSALHPHTTSGVLTGQGSAVAGDAAHVHASTGALTGPGASIVGSAAHSAAAGTHDATGDLVGDASEIAGSAELIALITKIGGDDAPSPHKGFNLEEWKKKRRLDDSIEAEIERIYFGLKPEYKEQAAQVIENAKRPNSKRLISALVDIERQMQDDEDIEAILLIL